MDAVFFYLLLSKKLKYFLILLSLPYAAPTAGVMYAKKRRADARREWSKKRSVTL